MVEPIRACHLPFQVVLFSLHLRPNRQEFEPLEARPKRGTSPKLLIHAKQVVVSFRCVIQVGG